MSYVGGTVDVDITEVNNGVYKLRLDADSLYDGSGLFVIHYYYKLVTKNGDKMTGTSWDGYTSFQVINRRMFAREVYNYDKEDGTYIIGDMSEYRYGIGGAKGSSALVRLMYWEENGYDDQTGQRVWKAKEVKGENIKNFDYYKVSEDSITNYGTETLPFTITPVTAKKYNDYGYLEEKDGFYLLEYTDWKDSVLEWNGHGLYIGVGLPDYAFYKGTTQFNQTDFKQADVINEWIYDGTNDTKSINLVAREGLSFKEAPTQCGPVKIENHSTYLTLTLPENVGDMGLENEIGFGFVMTDGTDEWDGGTDIFFRNEAPGLRVRYADWDEGAKTAHENGDEDSALWFSAPNSEYLKDRGSLFRLYFYNPNATDDAKYMPLKAANVSSSDTGMFTLAAAPTTDGDFIELSVKDFGTESITYTNGGKNYTLPVYVEKLPAIEVSSAPPRP